MKHEQILSDLVLAIAFMDSWEEGTLDSKVHRTWKGYPFEVIDCLQEADLIFQKRGSKSFYITDMGLKRAKEILKKLFPDLKAD
ncbi:MAG: DUF6429 family protein [Pseudomonadota bacterium]